MNPIINTTIMTVDDREFLLVDISNSYNNIGVCSISSAAPAHNERQSLQEIFFVGDEPIITMFQPNVKDKTMNKLITQIGSVINCDENIRNRFSVVSDNYFTYKQNLIKSVQPVLEMLTDGLYVLHVSKMIQSDGAGNFFWNSYASRHEVLGTADYNSVIGDENNFTPCFLVPSSNVSDYSDSRLKSARALITAGKQIGGVAYHLSGMFSVLLDGHHSAMACLLEDVSFECIVIEPLRNIMYESNERALELGRIPRPIALSSPFAKIPLSSLPESTLETFLLTRRQTKPINFELLKSRSGRTLRVLSKRMLSREVYQKTELLPDCAMIESAQAVTSLSEEQLQALLSGEVTFNGENIISSNYYNSIVVACNYLQYVDFKRFLDFALAILANSDLAATHKYIIDRLSNIMDQRVFSYFQDLIDNHSDIYSERIPIAESYIKRFNQRIEDEQKENKAKRNKNLSLLTPTGDMQDFDIAKMEAIVKKTSRR